jgi:hypothetical protein
LLCFGYLRAEILAPRVQAESTTLRLIRELDKSPSSLVVLLELPRERSFRAPPKPHVYRLEQVAIMKVVIPDAGL